MTWGQRIAFLQDWLRENAAAFGIPIALSVIGLLFLGIVLLRPAATGPDERLTGRVIFLIPPADPRVYNQADVVVELAGGLRLSLSTPPAQTCPIGAKAVVSRTPIKGSQLHRLLSCTTVQQKGDDGPRQAG